MKQILDNEVFDYFCVYPSARLGIRALAKAIKRSPTQASRLAKPLIKKGILSCEIAGRTTLLSANKKGDGFFICKKWNNLFLLIRIGVVEEFQKYNLESAVLFGSFCRGHDTETSDIDIAVSEKKQFSFVKVEQLLHKKVNVYIIRDVKPTVLENIRQGIALWGHMP